MEKKSGKKLKHETSYKEKQKPPITKPKVAVVVGREYTLQEIADLLADLRSKDRERSISASIAIIENSNAIAEKVAQAPDLNMTEINKEVLEVVKRDIEIILSVLEEAKRVPALTYLAKSEKMTPKINEMAAKTLKRIAPKEQPAEKAAEAPKPVAITPEQLKQVWSDLNSRESAKQVSAAIAVFSNIDQIGKAASKLPGLSKQRIANKAKDVTLRNTDPLLRQVILTWNRAVLGYIAKSKEFPPAVVEKAEQALKNMGPEVKAPVKEDLKREAPKEKPKKAEPPAEKIEAKPSEQKEEMTTVRIGKEEVETKKLNIEPVKYDEPKVKALWTNMASRQKSVAIKAAIDVFSNFQDISKVLPKIPMLTISQLTSKASDIASRNSNAFFTRLSQTRNKAALEFIAKSQAVSPELSKKAKEALEALLSWDKPVKKAHEPKQAFKEGGPDDEGDGDKGQN